MDNFTKVLILIALIAYVVSPVDFVPGPIDDAIMVTVYLLNSRNNGVSR